MEIWRGPRGATLDTGAGGCLLVHSLAGRCAARVDGGEPHDLVPGETLVHEGQGGLEVSIAEDSRAAVIQIRRLQARSVLLLRRGAPARYRRAFAACAVAPAQLVGAHAAGVGWRGGLPC